MEVPLRRFRRVKLQSFITVLKNFKSLFSIYEKLILAFCFLLIIFSGWKWAEAAGTKETMPAKGGSFIEGVVANSMEDVELGRLVKSGLVMHDQTGQIVADLAKSWEVSADKLTYTFKLQDNIKSYTLVETLVKNPTYLPNATADAMADDTLRITLSAQSPSFLDDVTKPLFAGGPYKVSKKKKTEIRLVLDKAYHLPKPYIEKVTVRIYPTQEELEKAAQKGAISGALDLTSVPEGWQTKKVSLNKKHILFVNSSKSYLKSLKVRDQLLSGQKPDSIKTLDVLEVNGDGVDAQYEQFKKKLTDAGIELNVRQSKLKDAVLSDLPKRNYDLLYLLVDDTSTKDPYKFYHSSQRTGEGQNFAEIANADLDTLAEQYRAAADEQKAGILEKINTEVQSEKIIAEYAGLEQDYYVSAKIKGFSIGTYCMCEADRFNEVRNWYIYERKKR
jgi:ABC-type transport system substrate-binding protein